MGKPRQLTDAQRQQRQERIDKAQAAVDALGATEVWSRWVRARANLHGFSWRNQVLLAEQLHERGVEQPGVIQSATRWKAAGYFPIRGQRALWVWTPHIYRDHEDRDAQGQPKRKTYFRLRPVFAAVQVHDEDGNTPEPPPRPEPLTGDSHASLFDDLREWVLEQGWVMAYLRPEELGGAWAYWDQRHQTIAVDDTLAPNATLAAVIHECVHALGISSRAQAEDKLTYAEAEVLTETTAMVVTAAVGLDTSSFSVPYITGWASAKPDIIARRAQLIHDTAAILEAVLIPKETHAPLSA